MDNTCFTILLAGRLTVTDRLRAMLAGCRVIAADGGIVHAAELGLTPELWVGDFDSADPALADRFPTVEQRRFSPVKAQTDGEIAAQEALARGAKKLVLVGAMGGERSDHALQHIVHALSLAGRGLDVILTSGHEEVIPLLPGSMTMHLPLGSLFSVIGFSDLEGLDVTGARYPLQNFTSPFGSSRTLSNVVEGPVTIQLERGKGIVLARPLDMTGA